ncbi:DUF4956 domain-containing protein [Ruminococcus sp. Marseille-P6503]|uniref:DUF4956 domain-containing protein n=1 Tax=Ruminococcus sp. Marseille-P6503 TaxID=2364796 RepID=UPI0019D01044
MHNLISASASISTADGVSTGEFILYTLISLALGAVVALVFRYKNKVSKGFSITLAMLPAIVQVVIMLVNGNIGTGVAVMGAFSLVRFRSVPGNARDICSIFLAMAIGLAMGTGYALIAVIFTAILCAANLIYSSIPIGDKSGEKQLIITIPESLDYSDIFDDLFEKYTSDCKLVNVKTTNMGSLFKLTYKLTLKNGASEKALIDDLRCRNGNLEISCGQPVSQPYEQL